MLSITYETKHYKKIGIKLQMPTSTFMAESVAYVVCQHLGINTSDYSFGYVAGWSDGKETPELKASLGTIRNAAADMITAIDEKLEHVRGAIEKATNEFTSIFMQDQDKGNLMMGEYLSMLNYDSEMGDKGVQSSKLIVEDFLKKDIHTESEIRETGNGRREYNGIGAATVF